MPTPETEQQTNPYRSPEPVAPAGPETHRKANLPPAIVGGFSFIFACFVLVPVLFLGPIDIAIVSHVPRVQFFVDARPGNPSLLAGRIADVWRSCGTCDLVQDQGRIRPRSCVRHFSNSRSSSPSCYCQPRFNQLAERSHSIPGAALVLLSRGFATSQLAPAAHEPMTRAVRRLRLAPQAGNENGSPRACDGPRSPRRITTVRESEPRCLAVG